MNAAFPHDAPPHPTAPPHRPIASSTGGLALLLAAILFATRLPLIDHPFPVHPDESEFMAGLGFPRPYPVHPPGYPGWVALGSALHSLGVSPYHAYQYLSIAGSLLAPVLLFSILARSFPLALAWWTALAFGINPLLWFCGLTALNYAAACALGLAVAGLALAARAPTTGNRRSARAALAAALVLAAAGLLRPDLLVWLAPLVALALARAPRRAVAVAVAALAASLALTLLFSRHAYAPADPSGGAAAGPVAATARTVFQTSVFNLGIRDGLLRNAAKLALNLAWHLGAPTLVLIAALALPGRRSDRRPTARTMNSVVLVAWTAPLLAFVLLVHMSEPGHLLLIVPAAYVALAAALHRRRTAAGAARAAAIAALVSLIQFTGYPWRPESPGIRGLIDRKIAYISAAGLRGIDRRHRSNAPGDFWPTPVHQPPASSNGR